MDINSPLAQILYLHRTIGNQAVTRLIQSGALQAKLRIGQQDDIDNQETVDGTALARSAIQLRKAGNIQMHQGLS